MKTSLTPVAVGGIVATFATFTSASMHLTGCSVSHNSGNGGNQFSMSWDAVPSQSRSSLCGSFANRLRNFAQGSGMQVKGDIECSTNGASMFTRVTLNKHSCLEEADIIGQAMANALGNSGPLNFQGHLCGNPAC